ncbi:electron transporter RnfC, partial [Candidatus Magnetoovum chiemensis]
MNLATFLKGGIHPAEKKEYTSSIEIKTAKIPKKIVIPLSQHIGAPCKPLVEVGARVKVGQKIGEASGFVSAPVHSSVSGKVVEIAAYALPTGRMSDAIVIENDNLDEWIDHIVDDEYIEKSPEILKARIKEAGIVGMGGATFPTHVKLSPPKEKTIDTIIINGAECEPYLTSDHRVMVERPDDVIDGLKILMRILSVSKGFIGIEENKPDAVKKLRDACRDKSDIEIRTLKVKYPQGAEKMLIKSIVDRDVPAGGLPMDIGVVVQNAGTAVAIYEACRYGKPLIERVVSVTGKGVAAPGNYKVRIGTFISSLVEECGGLKKDAAKIICGGPMMGFAIHSLEVPVIKGTSGIVVLTEKEVAHSAKFSHCIRCGRCVEACPMGLMPNMLSLLSEKSFYGECKDYNLFDCFECGCCTFVCPAKR